MYYYDERTINWGEDLSPETMEAMADGELFMLLDDNGLPYRYVARDSFGEIREKKATEPIDELLNYLNALVPTYNEMCRQRRNVP